MPEPILFLLKILSILCLLGHSKYTTLAHQQNLDRVSNSIKTITNDPSLTPANNSSHANASASGPHAMDENSLNYWGSIVSNKAFSALSRDQQIHPRSIVDDSTELPAPFNRLPNSPLWLQNYQDILSGSCTFDDSFCSFKASNGSIINAGATDLHDECLLWDDSCSGNRTAAIEKFFDMAFRYENQKVRNWNGPLMGNLCFQQRFVNLSDCAAYNPPERSTEFLRIKNWMRSSQCVSAADEWIAMTGYNWGRYFGTENETKAEYIHDSGNSSVLPSCCGTCLVQTENVDLYYWPEPNSDTSCLSVIGNPRPVDYGATTESGITYWACSWTQSSTTGILTTATITTVGALAVKVSNYSPWSSSPCEIQKQGYQNQSIKARDGDASVYRRAHSLIVPTAITQAGGLPISTLVSGQFTFTSPSIYAQFHGLSMEDMCGSSVIWSTMLSFSAGELSTIQAPLGPPGIPLPGPNGVAEPPLTRRFDFGDLPCPPQSIMEANWYKPQSGEPYRPLIAFPSKIKEIAPWFSYCDAFLFTAYDPPRALTKVTALAPPAPPNGPKIHPGAPGAPTSSPTPGSKIATTHDKDVSVPRPAHALTVDQPKATMNANPAKKVGSKSESQIDDPASQKSLPSPPPTKTVQPNSNPKPGSDPKPQSNSVPKGDSDSNQASDPNHTSDPKPEQNSNPTQCNDPKPSSYPTRGSDPKSQPNKEPPQCHSPHPSSDSLSDSEQDSRKNENSDQGDPNRDPFPNIISTPPNNAKQTQHAESRKNLTRSLTSKDPERTLAIASSTLDPGGSGVTMDGKMVSLNTNSPEATALVPNLSDTTTSPRSPKLTFNGTIASPSTAAKSEAGTRVISLEGSSGGATAGLGESPTGAFGTGEALGPNQPSSGRGNVSDKWVGTTTGTSPQAFAGGGPASLGGRSVWDKMMVTVAATFILRFL